MGSLASSAASPVSQTIASQRNAGVEINDKQVPASKAVNKGLFQYITKTAQSIRQRYLDYLKKDVHQRLKASIHEAIFLDIGIDEKLNATLPWHYVAPDEQRQFVTFDQAFEHYEGRVL
jgi:hypothetical protein